MSPIQILLLSVEQAGVYTFKQTVEMYTVNDLTEMDNKVSELKNTYEGRTDREIKVASRQGSALWINRNGIWVLSNGFYF